MIREIHEKAKTKTHASDLYKYQMREHPKNKRLGNMLDDLGDVHNHFLALEKRYYRIGMVKYAGRYPTCNPHLTKLLKRTTASIGRGYPRDTLDEVIVRIHITYERFFDGLGGLPKFKRKDRYRSTKFQSAYQTRRRTCPYFRLRLGMNPRKRSLNSTNAGFLFTSTVNGRDTVRYIQILRDAVGTFWLYVVTDDASTDPYSATGESVGIDFGLETYLTLNTGEKIQHPQPLKQSLKQLRTLHKSLSRKVKGSNNYWRAIRELVRLYRHIANQRKDWHYKLATDLCRRFDTIAHRDAEP